MKTFRFLSIAATAMLFAACANDDDTALTLERQEINATFSVGGVQTRVNTLGTGTCWEDKDEIKACVSCDSYTPTTAVLSFNGETNDWTPNGSFYWFSATSSHTIQAVYPSSCSFESYGLPTDQTSLESLKSADLINGVWYGTKSSQVDIPMKHRMSMVTVTYEVGTADYPDMDISEPQVCSKYAGVTFSVDKTNGLVMSKPETTTSTWVTAYKHDTNKFSAIVIPGSYEASDVFLKLKVGTKNFSVKIYKATEFQEGYRYEYKVKVGENKVELTEINADTFDGWTTEEDLN